MTDLATKPEADLEADVEIDSSLLDEARRHHGGSPNEVINAALKGVVYERRGRRGRAYDNVQRMMEEGLLDLDAIGRISR